MPDSAAKANVEASLQSSLVNSLALERLQSEETKPSPDVMPRALGIAGNDRALMVHQALGARIVDTDGTSYVDLCMGHGSLMLGHGAAPIKAALQSQIELGWMHGFSHLVGEQLAELIHQTAPGNERVILCGSESDAIMLALRAARAFRSRKRIVLFSGAIHGLHDISLVTAAQAHGKNFDVHRNMYIGASILTSIDEDILALKFGSDASLETISQQRDTLAAVIVEPTSALRPSLEHGAWLTRLQTACQRNSVPLILDETFSGFRIGFGGAQVFFDLRPDLVVYGKALGGGLPIGAVAGRAEIMSTFSGGISQQRVNCSATPAVTPLSAAAAEAIMVVLATHRDTIYPQLHHSAAELATNFNTAAERLGIAAHMFAAASVFRIVFGDINEDDFAVRHFQHDARQREKTFYRNVFQRRVAIHQSKLCFLSTAHTLADLTEIYAAFIQSLEVAAR